MIFLVLIFASLASAEAPEICKEVHSEPQAIVYRCDRLTVVKLMGDGKTRFETYGRLLKGPLKSPVVDYFSRKIIDVDPQLPTLGKKSIEATVNLLTRFLHRKAIPQISEELDAMAKGMGMDPIALRRAISLADLGTIVHRLSAKFPILGLPASGCTSVAARFERNGLFFGRNLDFIGVGHWDQHPSIVIHSPPTPELKYMAFAANGMPWAGITGANEAGIFFAVHQNYSSSATLTGTPMPFIGELVLRKARSLREAEEIIQQFRPSSLWTFLLADLKTGEARAVEVSPKVFGTRPMNGSSFAQTNHSFLEETKLSDQISIGTAFNSENRWKKAMESLEKEPPSFERVRDTLSYQKSPNGWMQPGEDILKAHTIQTVIVEGRGGTWSRLWISQDEAPVSSGSFLSFDPMGLFLLPQPLFFSKVNTRGEHSEKRARQIEIAQAFSAYFDRQDFQRASNLLKGHPTLSAGLLRATAAHNQGHWSESLGLTEALLRDPRFLADPAHIRESVHWLGLINLAKLERWTELQQQATSLLKGGLIDPRRKILAKSLVEGRKISLGKPIFEFFTGDLTSPGEPTKLRPPPTE